MSKLFVVFGATSKQGGSAAHYVLNDHELSKQYSVRAITRSVSNPKAQELKTKGAEIVEADLDQPETYAAALKGVHTAYLITYTQMTGDTYEVEMRQAKALVNEALKQGAQYLIWSSMSHPSKITNGKLSKVTAFDVKADVEIWIRTLPIKASFYAPASFMQNFQGRAMTPRPSPANDGSYVMTNLLKPDSKLPLIDITDTGVWVGAILADPDKYEGKQFAAADRCYTFSEVAATISKITGKKVTYQQLDDEVFAGFLPEPVREMYKEMFQFDRDYGYYGPTTEQDVKWARDQARGKVTTLEEFLKKENFTLE